MKAIRVDFHLKKKTMFGVIITLLLSRKGNTTDVNANFKLLYERRNHRFSVVKIVKNEAFKLTGLSDRAYYSFHRLSSLFFKLSLRALINQRKYICNRTL